MTDLRKQFAEQNRWVVKIGSALITADGRGLDTDAIRHWAGQIATLMGQGKQILLVSSGAVAEGMARMGMDKRPNALHQLQAAAAIGQMGLIQHFESSFNEHGIRTAQVLLTHEDLSDRERYLNSRSTLRTLLEMGVMPIINENDTVATEEIRLGDNDTLGALVTNLVEAQNLVILTDQQGLYDKDPHKNKDAKLIEQASAGDDNLMKMAGGGGALGRGGMVTKLRAARLAARSGTETVIVDGRESGVLARIAKGEELGTWLGSGNAPETARRQWLASLVTYRGELIIDDGAARVLWADGRSLLPVGIREVKGSFQRGDVVLCRDLSGREIARGLSNYSSDDAERIKGHSSEKIADILGYGGEAEMLHRDNLVVL